MIQKRIMVWIGLFSVGYLTANQGLPKGEEFLIFQIAAWLVGFGHGLYWIKLSSWMRKRRNNSESGKRAPVVKLVRSDPLPVPPVKIISCDFCQDEEEIRLAGQKIKCPKCKGKVATAN